MDEIHHLAEVLGVASTEAPYIDASDHRLIIWLRGLVLLSIPAAMDAVAGNKALMGG